MVTPALYINIAAVSCALKKVSSNILSIIESPPTFLVAATKAAADAVLKVSETDTPQKDWNNTEWVVFTAREIMQQADKVSEDDLHLLHDIMIRCQTEPRDAAGAERIARESEVKQHEV